MREMDNPLFQHCWQVIDQLLVVYFKQCFLMIIFDELFDTLFQVVWQTLTFCELAKHRKFLLQVGSFAIDRANNGCEVTDRERVEANSHKHPNNRHDNFSWGAYRDVAITDCGEGLE